MEFVKDDEELITIIDNRKIDNTLSLLRQLRKISVASTLSQPNYKSILCEIFLLLVSCDMTLSQTFLEWLSSGIDNVGWIEGKKLYHKIIQFANKTCPITMESLPNNKGYCLAVLQERCFKSSAEAPSSSSSASTAKLENEHDRVLCEVSCISLENFKDGFIACTIEIDDIIGFNTKSKQEWKVVDIRPDTGLVHLVEVVDTYSKKQKHLQQRNQKKNAPPETRECKLFHFLGATIKRRGKGIHPVLANNNNEREKQRLKLNYDAEDLQFFANKKTSERNEQPMLSRIIFKFPSIEPSLSIMKLTSIVNAQQIDKDSDEDLKISRKVSDPIERLQNQALVTKWLERKEDVIKARRILLSMVDPFIAINRNSFHLVCRLLKTISKGEYDLLDDFIKWNMLSQTSLNQSIVDISRKCRQAWESQRPHTNCDLKPLCSARIFLNSRGINKSENLFNGDGKLVPDLLMKFIDPMRRAILESAAEMLSERNLIFLKKNDNVIPKDDCNGNSHDNNNHNEDSKMLYEDAIKIPAAIYSFSSNNREINIDQEKLTTSSFIRGERINAAYITAGDVICVKELTSSSFAPQTQMSTSCYRVLSIDLLFARVRVSPCPYPPLCFQINDVKEALWIPVSKLWDVTVSRLLPSANSEEFEYKVFVIPIPSNVIALSTLISLPRIKPTETKLFKSASKPPLLSSKGNTERNEKVNYTYTSEMIEKVSLSVVESFEEAVIVKWDVFVIDSSASSSSTLSSSSSRSKKKEKTNTKKESPLRKLNAMECSLLNFSIEISVTASSLPPNGGIPSWKEVYRGNSLACQVSGLEMLSLYNCRVKLLDTTCKTSSALSKSSTLTSTKNNKNSYKIINTIAAKPLLCPIVTHYEEGIIDNTARLTVNTNLSYELEDGCSVSIECSLKDSHNENDDSDDDVFSKKENMITKKSKNDIKSSWKVITTSTSKRIMIVVGPVLLDSILLRTRIINQSGMQSFSSPIAVIKIPKSN